MDLADPLFIKADHKQVCLACEKIAISISIGEWIEATNRMVARGIIPREKLNA